MWSMLRGRSRPSRTRSARSRWRWASTWRPSYRSRPPWRRSGRTPSRWRLRVKHLLAGFEASVKTAQTARDQREAEKKAEIQAKADAEAEVAELKERAFPAHGAVDQTQQRVPDDPRIQQAAGRSPAQIRRSPGPARLVPALKRCDLRLISLERRARSIVPCVSAFLPPADHPGASSPVALPRGGLMGRLTPIGAPASMQD